MRLTLLQNQAGIAASCDFVPPGGTIGRSSDNDLVLPDADRAISRLQALIHVTATGECRLTNQGSVITMLHNDVPLARGQQVTLVQGDLLTIGNYRIAVGEPFTGADEDALDDPLLLFAAEPTEHADPLGILHPDVTAVTSGGSRDAAPVEARVSRHSDARLGIDPIDNESATSDAPVPAAADREQRLLNALFDGMGLEQGPERPALTEEQMRQTGRMLSLFSQGTVALLSSRSILKRGVKADMTMILNEANNPFKILPSGKTVLMQIYQSQMPGFMAPEQAVRDALIDLQAHQLGMIAGIRAIIAAMLQSFNPLRLEENARQDNKVPRLGLSATRKAALWDYFVNHYHHTSDNMEDDFHTLFGDAFLQAYDVEVNQYKDSQILPENR